MDPIHGHIAIEPTPTGGRVKKQTRSWGRAIPHGATPYCRRLQRGPLECKAKVATIGRAGLYAEHMMRVRRMLARRNRKMMIWWNEKGLTEKAADRLAKDIVIFDWHYGNQHAYPSLDRLRKCGFTDVWATPAVTRYYGRTNDYDNTFGNIRGFLTAGAERGVPGQCTCTWVHGIWGGRNLFELNYYGLLYSAQCAWKPANADPADFRWRMARHWFALPLGEGGFDALADDMQHAWHAPFGKTAEQAFWANCRDAEKRLAAAPGATIADIVKVPGRPVQAKRLLGFCSRSRAVLQRWRTTAQRNHTTIDFLIHDAHIYETLARRILALDALRRVYPQARRARPEQRDALLKPVCAGLRALAADYREIERMFARSITEAGGGRCGWGPWFPFVTSGGILFRAAPGRQAVEQLLARLASARDKPDWPKQLW